MGLTVFIFFHPQDDAVTEDLPTTTDDGKQEDETATVDATTTVDATATVDVTADASSSAAAGAGEEDAKAVSLCVGVGMTGHCHTIAVLSCV